MARLFCCSFLLLFFELSDCGSLGSLISNEVQSIDIRIDSQSNNNNHTKRNINNSVNKLWSKHRPNEQMVHLQDKRDDRKDQRQGNVVGDVSDGRDSGNLLECKCRTQPLLSSHPVEHQYAVGKDDDGPCVHHSKGLNPNKDGGVRGEADVGPAEVDGGDAVGVAGGEEGHLAQPDHEACPVVGDLGAAEAVVNVGAVVHKVVGEDHEKCNEEHVVLLVQEKKPRKNAQEAQQCSEMGGICIISTGL